eukprot:SAG11_NODE_114_length_16040_cov_10.050875_21_plen_72_part_00
MIYNSLSTALERAFEPQYSKNTSTVLIPLCTRPPHTIEKLAASGVRPTKILVSSAGHPAGAISDTHCFPLR